MLSPDHGSIIDAFSCSHVHSSSIDESPDRAVPMMHSSDHGSINDAFS
jgi:hypothetical protein